MTISRLTLLLQNTTDPQDREAASPHTGGWSESWWANAILPLGASGITALVQKRAALLPKEASVVGKRVGLYNLSGNKLLPQGSATAKVLAPGSGGRPCDLPQVALEMSGTATGAANKSRFVLRCMPDEIMVRGEYQPGSTFKGLVTQFCNEIASQGWGFIGRDLAQPAFRVLAIAAGVVTLDGDAGGVVNTSYLRLNRVFDNNENPVKGAFRITAKAGNNYTLAGLDPAIVAAASGTARIDLVTWLDFATVVPSRAVVKKIGRPFEGYRGRQSNR